MKEGNTERAYFNLLKCVTSKHITKETMIDAWDNMIKVGTYFIEGIFYEKVDDYGFKLLDASSITRDMLVYQEICCKICSKNEIYPLLQNPWQQIHIQKTRFVAIVAVVFDATFTATVIATLLQDSRKVAALVAMGTATQIVA